MCDIVRKMHSIVMVVIIMISLIGCGNGAGETAMKSVEDKTDVTFEGINMKMDGIDGSICHYLTQNQKIYILTMDEVNEDETQKNFYQFYSSGLDGLNVEKITNISTEQDIVSFCVDSMENIIYISTSSKEEAQVIELVKIDNQGTEIVRSDITKVIKDDVQMISGILSDASGQIIMAYGDKICFFDEQLQVLGECLTSGEYVIDVALTKNNQLVCVLDKLDSDVVDIKVCMLDVTKKQWGDEINIGIGENGEQDCVFESVEYDFCYKGNSGINGYNVETDESTELINYDASYMTDTDAEGMICVGEGVFVGKSEIFTGQKSEISLVLYTKKDETKVSEKEAITFGTYYATPNIKSAIAKYNRNNTKYEIVIQEYCEMDEDRLLTDIIAGNGQDIMDLSSFPLSIEQCISKGLIEDLTPYYEKDVESSINDMVGSVRKAMEKEGKIYYIAPSFSLTSVVAKTEVVGNKKGWTVSEFRETMEQVGEDVGVFSYEDIKMSYLAKFMNNNMEDYIDWEKGECNFDSEEFRYILSFCNERGLKKELNVSDTEIIEEVNSQYSRLRDGKYVLLENDSINLYSIQMDRKAIGEDITYIGYPNEKKQGSYFKFSNKLAISSQSKVKEQAWQFIRSFMSVEYQKTIDCDCCMPTSQVVFDNKLKTLTATEAYVDEFGDSVQPMENYTLEWGDMEIVMEVPTQEDVDMYLDLINQTEHCVDSDMVVFNIIMEEAKDYFNGRKKLDKTVDVIQNRVSTYVNEQK